MIHKKTLFFLYSTILLSGMFVPVYVFGAEFNYTPVSKTIELNDTITIVASVDSAGQAVNAFSGVIDFDPLVMSFVSLTTTGTIVDYWTVAPALTSPGRIEFEGISYSPGYTGSNGTIVQIKLKGIAVTTSTDVLIHDASILANDGNGTNVFSLPFPITQIVVKKTVIPPEVPEIEEPPTIPVTTEETGEEGGEPEAPLEPNQNPTTEETETLTSEEIKEIPLIAKDNLNNIQDSLKNISSSPVADVVIIGGGLSAIFAALLPTLSLNPGIFSNITFALLRLWSLILIFFGIKKKIRPWGVVYDSITKQPIDPAYVVLYDQNGGEVATGITDVDGRYGFVPEYGYYSISAAKTNYTFPSQILHEKKEDELYTNLYFGEPLLVNEEQGSIVKNIPLDPVGFDWNQFEKKRTKMTHYFSKYDSLILKISSFLFWVGFVLSALALYILPSTLNIVVVITYILLLVLRQGKLRPKVAGSLRELVSGLPMSFALVRVYSASGNLIATKVANMYGKYICLVPKGNYYVSIEAKKEDGTYEDRYTSSVFSAQKGYINTSFRV